MLPFRYVFYQTSEQFQLLATFQNLLVLAHDRRRILHLNVTQSSDRDGAQILLMDEDSPAVEAAAEGRSTTATIPVMKGTQPVTFGRIASMTEM